MKSQISLRQHKIIQILRNKNSYMTSDEIAEILNVSSRTVRNDISDINYSLSGEGINIESVKSRGFIIRAKDPESLKKFSKDHNLFLGRSDRLFYLSIRLCAADEPIDLFDLEDELAVSTSTLTGDITAFKDRFVHGVPYIKLNVSKNAILPENNERKKRFIMTKLLCDNWDYNSTGNVYYESDFIDSGVFNIINSVVAGVLFRHDIHLDDYSLVFFNLNLSIAYHRLLEGHEINHDKEKSHLPADIEAACKELFTILDERLDRGFPDSEKVEAGRFIEECRIPYNTRPALRPYPELYYSMAVRYIERIKDEFRLDFSNDDEFFGMLLEYIYRLHRPMKDIAVRDTPDNIISNYTIAHSIALLFHRIAESEGLSMTKSDLLCLTYAISGKLSKFFKEKAGNKFKAVIMCHMNINAMWALRKRMENQFGGYLQIIDVIPVNHKDFYDFSKADIILTTVNKKITGPNARNLIQISPYLNADDVNAINERIRNLVIKQVYPKKIIPLRELLDNAIVHEKMLFNSRFDLIEFMCRDFIEKGIYTSDHMFSILKRESVSSFASMPAVLLLYSTIPCTETKMSVLTLDHRIMWNGHKIRYVFMISFRKEDMREIFYLKNAIFHMYYDPGVTKHFKTIEEIRKYYTECELENE